MLETLNISYMNDVLKECSDKENAIASLQYVYECEIKISRC